MKGSSGNPPFEQPELSLNGFKRAHVRQVLDACDGDVEKAARLLGVESAEVLRWLQAANGGH